MGFVSVIAAAVAAYVFGAIWYMAMAKSWMAASGVAVGEDGRPANSKNPLPYIVSIICLIIVAGMMRHMFVLSGITEPGKGLVAGLGAGLFLAVPWLTTNYTFAGRPRALILLDGIYATGGSAIIGLVLTLI